MTGAGIPAEQTSKGRNSRNSGQKSRKKPPFSPFLSPFSKENVAVIEVGAGLAIASIRHFSESFLMTDSAKSTLIRVNPRDTDLSYASKKLAESKGNEYLTVQENGLAGITKINAELEALST